MLYPIKQLNRFLVNDTITVLCSFTYTTLVRDCCLTGLLVSIIHSQPFRHLNVSLYNPSYLSPTVLNIHWQIKPTTYGYEPSVTVASKPKKQIYQKMFGSNTYVHTLIHITQNQYPFIDGWIWNGSKYDWLQLHNFVIRNRQSHF
jgi:hypothetical protein